MNETINDVLRKDYDSCVKSLKKSEKKREKTEKENQRLKDRIDFYEDIESDRLAYIDEIEKENQRLKNIIYTTLEYVDREEVSSAGTPFTSTSIGKEIKELLEGEKTFNSIWKENQRLNNDIKILLKENEAKEKVIIKYDNVLNELEKFMTEDYNWLDKYGDASSGCAIGEINRIKKKLKELKESDK